METKVFEGQTTRDVHPTADLQFPVYPIYDRDEGKGDPLRYSNTATALDLAAMASRLVPLSGSEEQRVVLPRGAFQPELFAYYRELYGPQSGTQENVVFFEGLRGYVGKFQNGTRGKIACLIPHLGSLIDPERYYVDPHLIMELNDKNNLGDLSDQIPERDSYLVADLLDAAEQFEYPFYVKEATGDSGNTVFRIDSENDLAEAQKKLSSNQVESALVEECFEHTHNYNIQIHVSPEGAISLVGYSLQRTDKDGNYLGNIMQVKLDLAKLPRKVLILAMQAASKAYDKGWHGIVGFDILHNASADEVKLIDPNFRWNGSSPYHLLRPTIGREANGSLLMSVALYPTQVETVREAIEALNNPLERGDLFLIGGAEHKNGVTRSKLYGGFTGDSVEEIEDKKQVVTGLGFTIK